MNLMQKRGLWFVISMLAMLPGLIYMITALATGKPILPLSIDYTGRNCLGIAFYQSGCPCRYPQNLCGRRL